MAQKTLCCEVNNSACEKNVAEYYTTAGTLATLCGVHLSEAHIVWDGDNPITKKYYDEVYRWKTDRAVITLPKLRLLFSYSDFWLTYQRACYFAKPQYLSGTESEEEIFEKFLAVAPDKWKEKFKADFQLRKELSDKN